MGSLSVLEGFEPTTLMLKRLSGKAIWNLESKKDSVFARFGSQMRHLEFPFLLAQT